MNELTISTRYPSPRSPHEGHSTKLKIHDAVFLQNELQYFFDHAIIPIYSGDRYINFMDYFPMLKQGYASRRTVGQLMDAYIATHNLYDPNDTNYIIPDALFIAAFGGDIAVFYYYESFAGARTMQEVVERGFIDNYLNAFQVMSARDPTFNPNRIGHFDFDFDFIIYLDCMNLSDFLSLSSYLRDENFVAALINERAIADDFLEIVKRQETPITITTTMEIAVEYEFRYLLNRLLADDRVNKLIYAIITDDPDLVKQYIDTYDPRDNDFEAYHLAIEHGNSMIIDEIKRAIIEKNLLEQATFRTMMTPIGNLDQPPVSKLYQHSQALLNK